MRKEVEKTLPMLRQAHEFLARENPEAAYGPITELTRLLGEHVERLEAFTIERDARGREALGATAELRQRTRRLKFEFLLPTSIAARIFFRGAGEMATLLRYPGPTRNPMALVVAARAMANHVAQHRASFEAHGFAPDAAERIEAAAIEVVEMIDHRAMVVGRRAAAVAGMLEEVESGRAVLGVIDSMVRPRFARDPALIAEWRQLVGERLYPNRQSPRSRARASGVESPVDHSRPSGVESPVGHSRASGVESPIDHTIEEGDLPEHVSTVADVAPARLEERVTSSVLAPIQVGAAVDADASDGQATAVEHAEGRELIELHPVTQSMDVGARGERSNCGACVPEGNHEWVGDRAHGAHVAAPYGHESRAGDAVQTHLVPRAAPTPHLRWVPSPEHSPDTHPSSPLDHPPQSPHSPPTEYSTLTPNDDTPSIHGPLGADDEWLDLATSPQRGTSPRATLRLVG